jgi:type IV pilus assembly protein PilW
VRRVSTCVAGVGGCDDTSGLPYFQASLCTPPVPGGTVASGVELSNVTNPCPLCNDYFRIDTTNLTLHTKACSGTDYAGKRRYLTHIYYIANNNNSGDGIPTLKRAELGADAFSIMPLVEGIENLQLEYGIDTNADGTADVFTADADAYVPASLPATCLASGAACNWWNVVSVKVHLLARNTEPSPGYDDDDRTYVLGLDAEGEEIRVNPSDDAFRRHAYSATVRLVNPSGRRQ